MFPTVMKQPLRMPGPLESEMFVGVGVPAVACSDCRFAELFSVRPSALCRHPDAPLWGRVVGADPPCANFALRTAATAAPPFA
jgi:hypothetical protein